MIDTIGVNLTLNSPHRGTEARRRISHGVHGAHGGRKKNRVVVRYLLSFHSSSPTGLAKAIPPLLHTGVVSWALAVPPLAKRHSLPLCFHWGILISHSLHKPRRHN